MIAYRPTPTWQKWQYDVPSIYSHRFHNIKFPDASKMTSFDCEFALDTFTITILVLFFVLLLRLRKPLQQAKKIRTTWRQC